jgi:hypothetical protein
MEYWSEANELSRTGSVRERAGDSPFQYSNTPILHHSRCERGR